MLKRIRLIDFKSFVDEGVELAPLTLLVGANASGKSNFLDAIRFLQGTTLDLLAGEMLDGERRSGSDAWPGIRGRSEETSRIGTSAFAIQSVWRSPQQAELLHSVRLVTLPTVRRAEEKIEYGDRHHRRDGGGKGLFGRLDDDEFRSPEVAWLKKVLRDAKFLDLKPSEMRGYGQRGYPLGAQGQNISGVLRDLSETAPEKRSLVDWLAELCASEIVDFDFLEVKELGDVMAMFIEKGGKRISARSISDGTLHFLGTLLALRTAEPGSILLIEEIETGLHPTRIRLLVEYLEAVTRERQIQVIATTHSPVVLQWLSDESLRNTIVFGRVPDREGTIMRRIGDLPHFEEVIQRKGIDELFTTGWLEMAL